MLLRMKKIWREPLLHFLLLGAILFALYARINPGAESDQAMAPNYRYRLYSRIQPG